MTWNSYLNRLTQIRRRLEIESLEQRQMMTAGFVRYPVAETFELHSLEGAPNTIYLDFDGHANTPPYSSDADPAFSNRDLIWIQQIWQGVVEDFLPFNVDVTTEEPANFDNGVRVAIGGSCTVAPAGCQDNGLPGVWGTDTPALVFADYADGAQKYQIEFVSHQLGHTLGLSHDGLANHPTFGSLSMYPGVGGWAPIMGLSYVAQVTQWSNGNYDYANNFQDDVAILRSTLGTRPDDHGNTRQDATLIGPGTYSGVITTRTDVDTFEVNHSGGALTVRVQGLYQGDLDTKLTIYNKLYPWPVAMENPAGSLDSGGTFYLPAGKYVIEIDGDGKEGSFVAGEWVPQRDDYGSMGGYQLTVSGGAVPALAASAVDGVFAKKAKAFVA